jgi:ankyrin repeat protein
VFADAPGFNWQGATALHWAAAAGNEEQIKLLLGAGARVTAVMDNTHTCLSWAASRGKTSAVQLLLQA